eukprot:CAMPEP_0203958940 /NCGR_PEP_ID=MMETSP0359-20131031/90198_1 /ASSEMBLY_ACC=CAM_ASM_000338 /TAXON_ID=268821 /ORGANISM="Scrippsiella Hangoei, Strain SHTV-5" /LENGTH=58 /DNA_ID=CAMNT_0050892961 /DNA_START=48 /DNA_END=220 /DNA_ORIENTATION=+
MAGKIPVSNPIVEIDGDEVARSVWKMVKEKLVIPYVDVTIQYFDLALDNRIATMDSVT